MSADTADRRDRPGDRRPLVIGVGVALALALGAGSVFWLLLGDSEPAEPVRGEPTERAVASLPAPEATPQPVAAHFPSVDGLETAQVDDPLITGLEERLRPAGGEYAATRHRELRQGDEPVAVISLLRVGGEAQAEGLRRRALNGLGELFDSVDDGRVADEPVVRAESGEGAALLWLPDTGSVLVVSALDPKQAERVLNEVIGSVRGESDSDDTGDPAESEAALFRQ